MSKREETPAVELRRKAEEVVARTHPRDESGGGDNPVVHELRVHQIELEMQNEELRRLQSELESARARYFELFDLAPVGYITVGENGCVLEANLTGARMLGYTRAKLVGAPVSRLLDSASQGAFYLLRKNLLETGQPQKCELRLRHADGGATFAARLEATLAHSAEGERVARISFSNIDDIVEAQTNLQRSEQGFRELAENAADVVMRSDVAGVIEWITPSVTAMLGWDPRQLVGKPFRELVHPDDWARLGAVQSGLGLGSGTQERLRIRINGNGFHWFSISHRPVFDAGGAVKGDIAGWRDIQREVQAREALEAERNRLDATLDALLDPHVVLEAVRDEKGKIVDFIYAAANEAACVYNKLPRDQFVGRRLLEVLPAHSTSGLFDIYCRAMESGEPLVLNDMVYPHEMYAEERRYDIRAIRVGNALTFAWRDVTDRYLAAQKLAASEEQYRLLSENSYDTVVRVADDGVMLWVSPSLTPLLGWQPGEWIGRPLSDFLAGESGAGLPPDLQPAMQGERVRARYKLRSKDGCEHWMETFATPYVDAAGNRRGLVASFHDIEAQVAAEHELERRARTDELTHLLNRKEVFEQIAAIRGRPQRAGHLLAILFCDMDRFKTINDTYGHAAGDEVLRVMADRIRACLRTSDDLGARVGGDELLVVLHGVRELKDAMAVAEKLRSSAAEPIAIPGGTVNTSVSIGVTLANPHESADALVARADEAMYAAKEKGRNQVINIAETYQPN